MHRTLNKWTRSEWDDKRRQPTITNSSSSCVAACAYRIYLRASCVQIQFAMDRNAALSILLEEEEEDELLLLYLLHKRRRESVRKHRSQDGSREPLAAERHLNEDETRKRRRKAKASRSWAAAAAASASGVKEEPWFADCGDSNEPPDQVGDGDPLLADPLAVPSAPEFAETAAAEESRSSGRSLRANPKRRKLAGYVEPYAEEKGGSDVETDRAVEGDSKNYIDEDKTFLMSLLPGMKRLDGPLKMDFKVGVLSEMTRVTGLQQEQNEMEERERRLNAQLCSSAHDEGDAVNESYPEIEIHEIKLEPIDDL